MRFKLDGNTINDRIDWKHQTKPTPVSRMQFQTPGNTQLISLAEPSTSPDIIVTGFLVQTGDTTAEAVSKLDDQVFALSAFKGDGELHEVTIHNRVYKAVEVIEAATMGDITASDGGVRVPFGFQFRLLRADVETVEEEETP